MTKSFTTEERENIRRTLLEKGRALFEIYGLRKTTVADITRAVGIAKGSFYNFFSSKEELFFEIFEEEEHFREKLLADLVAADLDAAEALRRLLKGSLESVAASRIFEKLYEPGVYEQLRRKLSPGRMKAHRANDLQAGLDFVRHFQTHSNLRRLKPEVIIAFFRAIFTVTLHKDEIGPDVYPQVIDLLVDVVARGLVEQSGEE